MASSTERALRKQREEFLRRAAASAYNTKRALPKDSASSSSGTIEPTRRRRVPLELPKLKKDAFDYKTAKTCVATNFGVLAKVLDFMRKRHLEQCTWTLSLQEIFEELQMYDVPGRVRTWLGEILPQNSRISVDENNKYLYKPPYKIKGKNSLLNVLKRREMEGAGALLMSELADCVSYPDKIVQALGTSVISINVNVNKRKDVALFYNDTENLPLNVDPAFSSLWRSVNVGHLNEQRLEEYLNKHGIDASRALSSGAGPRESYVPKRKIRRQTVVHNEHLAKSGVLMDFSDKG